MRRTAEKMFIYSLIDPRDEKVFYIGQSKNPEVRLLDHLHKSHLRKTKKDEILCDLVKAGVLPTVGLIEEIPVDLKDKRSIFKVSERERFWIGQFLLTNSLLNVQQSKGDPNCNCSYCGLAFFKKHSRGKFCSDKCRVYWNRENKKVKITDLTKPTHQKLLEPQGAPKTNFVANTTKNEKSGELSSFERMRRKKLGL